MSGGSGAVATALISWWPAPTHPWRQCSANTSRFAMRSVGNHERPFVRQPVSALGDATGSGSSSHLFSDAVSRGDRAVGRRLCAPACHPAAQKKSLARPDPAHGTAHAGCGGNCVGDREASDPLECSRKCAGQRRASHRRAGRFGQYDGASGRRRPHNGLGQGKRDPRKTSRHVEPRRTLVAAACRRRAAVGAGVCRSNEPRGIGPRCRELGAAGGRIRGGREGVGDGRCRSRRPTRRNHSPSRRSAGQLGRGRTIAPVRGVGPDSTGRHVGAAGAPRPR